MSVPWRLGQLVTLYVTSVIGASLLVLAWYGSSGTARLSTAVGWVNVGVVGLVVAGTGNATWLLHGHRAVRARQRELVTSLSPDAAAEHATPRPAGDGALQLAVPGGRRAHRPGCPLLAGKATVAADDGLLPCEACR